MRKLFVCICSMFLCAAAVAQENFERNKKHEFEVLQNLLAQLRGMQDDLFDYEIEAGAPKNKHKEWRVPVTVRIKTTKNYLAFLDTLSSTLSSLKPSQEEQYAYYNKEIELNQAEIQGRHYLRSSSKALDDFAYELCRILNYAQLSCVIEDSANNQVRFLSFENINTLLARELNELPQTENYLLAESDVVFAYTDREMELPRNYAVVKTSRTTVDGYDDHYTKQRLWKKVFDKYTKHVTVINVILVIIGLIVCSIIGSLILYYTLYFVVSLIMR